MTKILILEDEQIHLEMYLQKLTLGGYQVLTAQTGKESLKVALQDKPDLIILDIIVPDKSGMQVLHEIRENDDWGKNVPIIMLTNLDINDERLLAVVQDQPSYYIKKSDITPGELLDKINQILKHT